MSVSHERTSRLLQNYLTCTGSNVIEASFALLTEFCDNLAKLRRPHDFNDSVRAEEYPKLDFENVKR